MKLTRKKGRLFAVLLSLGVSTAVAQSVPQSKSDQTPKNSSQSGDSASTADDLSASGDSTITLDPFTVTSETEGYQAVDSLGGARVRTSLKDTPSSISVITAQLMNDLGATNAQDLLVYTNDTQVSGLMGNFSGLAQRGQGISTSAPAENQRLVNPDNVTRARGLTAMDNTRNYFLSSIPWDGYNIDRVDISRGPNSFLFGVGSPSGIANVSTNNAIFADKGNLELRVGSFGSTRESLDYNKVIIPGELAVRMDLVNDNELFQQDPAFNHSQRAYGAVRFDPKLFNTDSSHMKILGSFESGTVTSNNPRMLPPLDYVTGYLTSTDPRTSSTGYNPWTYHMVTNSNDPTASPWTGNGSIGNENQWGNGASYSWDATTRTLMGAGQGGYSAPTTANYGNPNSNTYHVHTVGYNSYAGIVNSQDPTQFVGASAGTVTYLDKTLSDPSVFDFYNKLIDGNNKREWQNWKAFDLSVEESLFNSRLVVQAAVDHQDYRSGQEGVLNSRTPLIMLNLDSYLLTYPSYLPEAQTNPNVGRPEVFGGYGNGSKHESIRNNYQVTAVYDLNFKRDFAMNGPLGRFLGYHDVTVLGSRSDDVEADTSYKMYGIDPNWNIAYNGGSKITDNSFTWLAYLGPDLLGKSGAGANLSNLGMSITPPSTSITSYLKTWTAGTSVDPTAPWSVTLPNGSTTTLTQADNPANYKGYTGVPVSVLNSANNMDVLRTGSNRIEQKITSQAVMYQGHFWNDTIIPSFGWRRDQTLQRGDVANADPTTGLVPSIDSISDPGIQTTTTSTSYGVALHLPKSIRKNLPEGTDVSLYYFHGANETPKVRYGLDGSQLPNESGKTDDFSIQFDGFHGRATLRVTYFKTEDAHAAASYGQPLGANSWELDSMPTWTLAFAAGAIAAERLGPANLPSDAQGASWYWQWGIDHKDVAEQIAKVLQTDFIKLYPQSFFDKYGSNINVAAIQAGDWLHVVKGTDFPFAWSTTNNHVIHGQYPTIDQNLESKGIEVEATIRPLPNWDITFNGSNATAKQTALGASAGNVLNGMANLWLNTPLGMTAEWGSFDPAGTEKKDFMANLWAPYLQQVALTGADQPEWSKLKFNIISTYRFTKGWAKGLRVGGAFRWQDKQILGYRPKQATVFGQEGWLLDINQPIYGPTDEHFDGWIGYDHRLTPKVDWSLQLNLRNLGEKVHLVPVAYEPNGQIAQERIQDGMTWELTSRFSF